MPGGKYGVTSATTVATNMIRTFPSIRFGFMVGIGDGASSGVVQYDLGRDEQGKGFCPTDYLTQSPLALLTKLNSLKGRRRLKHTIHQDVLRRLVGIMPDVQGVFHRPSLETDKLAKSEFLHPDDTACPACASGTVEYLVDWTDRSQRHVRRDPAIHYVPIASGSGYYKTAVTSGGANIRRDFMATKYIREW
ncbi:hypothetical protein C1H76_7197 [Elsinoe australis]|uniref:Uncharacterized protein n=1 Tax=Elsinoe australis TaxID=40998 RepID=A0A4U7ARM8_9PEZI|nr:hypothetical protein C1H76_7197 [Elsinoe australis]